MVRPTRTPLPRQADFTLSELINEVGVAQRLETDQQAMMAGGIVLSLLARGQLDQSDREDAVEGLVQLLDYLGQESNKSAWHLEWDRMRVNVTSEP